MSSSDLSAAIANMSRISGGQMKLGWKIVIGALVVLGVFSAGGMLFYTFRGRQRQPAPVSRPTRHNLTQRRKKAAQRTQQRSQPRAKKVQLSGRTSGRVTRRMGGASAVRPVKLTQAPVNVNMPTEFSVPSQQKRFQDPAAMNALTAPSRPMSLSAMPAANGAVNTSLRIAPRAATATSSRSVLSSQQIMDGVVSTMPASSNPRPSGPVSIDYMAWRGNSNAQFNADVAAHTRRVVQQSGLPDNASVEMQMAAGVIQ